MNKTTYDYIDSITDEFELEKFKVKILLGIRNSLSEISSKKLIYK